MVERQKVVGLSPTSAAKGVCDVDDLFPHHKHKTCVNWRPIMREVDWLKMIFVFGLFAFVFYAAVVLLYVLLVGGN